jgi:hypothetical protein
MELLKPKISGVFDRWVDVDDLVLKLQFMNRLKLNQVPFRLIQFKEALELVQPFLQLLRHSLSQNRLDLLI